MQKILTRNITTDPELLSFKKDVLNSIRNIYAQRSPDVQITWLEPKGDKLVFVDTDDKSQKLLGNYYEFKIGEGIVGNAYNDNILAFYDKNTLPKGFVVRSGCDNKTYLCKKIGDFGVIGVGSNNGFILSSIDKTGLCLLVDAARVIIANYKKSKNE